MDIGTALRLKLVADGAVDAVFDGRIYPAKAFQAPVFPCAVYARAAGGSNYSHDGDSNLQDAHMQIDVYAESFDGLDSACSVLRASLSAWRGEIGTPPEVNIQGVFHENTIDWPVPETERAGPTIYRKTLEFNVFYSEI